MTIYDPFIGTGTTAVAAKRLHMNCYGSEISKAQVDYAIERVNGTVKLEEKSYTKQGLF